MQLASITFDGEKKNNKPYIIASVTFKNTRKRVKKVIEVPVTPVKKEVPNNLQNNDLTTEKKIVKPVLNTVRRRSALSLKSIHRDKEIAEIEVDAETVEGLPCDDFSENKVILLWNQYSANLLKDGKKILASILTTNKPKVVNNTIHFEVPTTLMRDQLESGKNPLMKFIKEKLNNFKVDLVIDLNEEETKKYAYTPFEKFEKLKEKNKAMELLKTTFDLDL
jgi:DNA polymerase-3 subunit gamma/tau